MTENLQSGRDALTNQGTNCLVQKEKTFIRYLYKMKEKLN